MKTKLMWFYQDVENTESQVQQEANKTSTSRQLQPSTSRINLVNQQTAPTYKKKLFLTDGTTVPLTGICIYIFRTNTTKQLPEEGFQKVKDIEDILSDVHKSIPFSKFLRICIVA